MIKKLRTKLSDKKISLQNKYFVNSFSPIFYDEKLISYSGGDSPSKVAISDHLCNLFTDIMISKAKLIVELGTRGGDSTKTILSVADYLDARVLSVDINPCGEIGLDQNLLKRWEFVEADDIVFGNEKFVPWCQKNDCVPEIDALFIDTSHEYEHTVEELQVWLKFVPVGGIVMFHDTNMGDYYTRMNNYMKMGWDNQRGVIRAIEEYLGREYDETKQFVDFTQNWLVRHHPYSSGYTFMKRMN